MEAFIKKFDKFCNKNKVEFIEIDFKRETKDYECIEYSRKKALVVAKIFYKNEHHSIDFKDGKSVKKRIKKAKKAIKKFLKKKGELCKTIIQKE